MPWKKCWRTGELKEVNLTFSLDAASTSIIVTVKAGGLKLLQIQDNGTGIDVRNNFVACITILRRKIFRCYANDLQPANFQHLKI